MTTTKRYPPPALLAEAVAQGYTADETIGAMLTCVERALDLLDTDDLHGVNHDEVEAALWRALAWGEARATNRAGVA